MTSGPRRKDISTRVDSSPFVPTLHGTPSPVKTRAGSQNGAAPRLLSDMQGRSAKAGPGSRKVAVAKSELGGSLGGGDNSAARAVALNPPPSASERYLLPWRERYAPAIPETA